MPLPLFFLGWSWLFATQAALAPIGPGQVTPASKAASPGAADKPSADSASPPATASPATPVVDPPRLKAFIAAKVAEKDLPTKPTEVKLGLSVDAEGRVTEVTVEQSATPALDAAATEAARQFSFSPALLHLPAPVGQGEMDGENSKAVPVRIIYRYKFTPRRAAEPAQAAAPAAPAESSDGMYESTVEGEREARKKRTVEQSLQAEEFRRIPGTQGDTLKAVQSLPGVARSPYGGGLLAVWGSAPLDTRVYVDGVYIPTLYHFGGLRSTVQSDMVERISFMPGGYGAEFGRGMGGVIDVGTRRVRKDGYHGFVQMDLIDASFLLEGPLSKRTSFAVSARRSWIDAILPLFNTSEFQLSPRYWDYQGKLDFQRSSRDRFQLFLFGSDDSISLQVTRPDPRRSGQFDSHIFYHRLLGRYERSLASGGTLEITPSVGYDVPFQIRAQAGAMPVYADISTFAYTLRAIVRKPVRPWLRIDTGLDFEGNLHFLEAAAASTGRPREGDAGFGGASVPPSAYSQDKLTLNALAVAPHVGLVFSLASERLVIAPQLRLEMLSATGYGGTPLEFNNRSVLVEPRLQIRFALEPNLKLVGAFGLYGQPTFPTDYARNFGNPNLEPQQAIHFVAGVEWDTHGGGPKSWHVEAQGFYKDLTKLVVRGKQPSDPLLVNEGEGFVYGGQLLVRKPLTDKFFGWLTYTLSRSERRDHPFEANRLFQYDQTHILSLLGSYRFGRGYELGLRFRLVTGNPFTPVVGAYWDNMRDRYIPLFGALYSDRLGTFHQLDLRFDKTWAFATWKLGLYVDIQNVYNGTSPEGITYNFDYRQNEAVRGLPFLPVLGLRGTF